MVSGTSVCWPLRLDASTRSTASLAARCSFSSAGVGAWPAAVAGDDASEPLAGVADRSPGSALAKKRGAGSEPCGAPCP